MKKYFRFLLLLLIPLMFTSCIDYVQSVSYKNGKYNLYYKVTVSRMLFAMAQQDPEAIFNGFPEVNEVEDLGMEARANRINTDLEVGIELSLKIDPKNVTEDKDELKLMLPTKSGNKYYIPSIFNFSPADFNSLKQSYELQPQAQAMATAVLSSAKIRILVSKKVIPEISSAYLESVDGEDTLPVSYYDFGDNYCFEIPLTIIYDANVYNIRRIVCIE